VKPLSRDRVLDAAAVIVERDGVEALSMRKLAAALGVAPPSIYWHVGNREQLLGALVDRIVAEAGAAAPRGRTPTARILSVARGLRAQLLARPHLVGLVNEHGRTPALFLPAQRALARELSGAGLPAARVALALRAVLFSVVGFVLLEINVARAPEQHPTTGDLWRAPDAPGRDIPVAVANRLAGGFDLDAVFEFSIRSIVDGALAG
jgi:AcrR family transcriptional regulator